MDALPEHTLTLLSVFEGRISLPGIEWNDVIKPQVETFLTGIRQTERKIRLYLIHTAPLQCLPANVLVTSRA